ncbi:MAG: hypothetical protein ACRDBQ_22040 [Shewanella sp.]
MSSIEFCQTDRQREVIALYEVHAASGGWRSRMNTQCIVFHRELGEIERHTIDISMV